MLEDLPNEHLLNALENAKPAVMPEERMLNLEARAVRFVSSQNLRFSRATIIGIAAALLLLIAANALLIQFRMKRTTQYTAAQSTKQYELIPVKSIYYE